MDWVPTISERSGPAYLRIVDALGADIASGRLVRGQQLPTHRALARSLRLDPTTVTRAYTEARRRGFIEATVGRGTFVSETSARALNSINDQVAVDLSMNMPPQPLGANLDFRIAKGLAEIQHQYGLGQFLQYQCVGGSEEQRSAAAQWLKARLPTATPDRVIIYPGTQAILFDTLYHVTTRGDTVLTGSLTYPGIKSIASLLGIRLVGVAMDDEGILPDDLERALKQHAPRAVYLIPTHNNPTTATLGEERRKMIGEIIRRYGTILLEDDAYGALDPSAKPVANWVGERTYLASSLSKCISPGMRVSFLLLPDAAAEKSMRFMLDVANQMAPPLMVALATHWIKTGVAERITTAIRWEASARQKLAQNVLSGFTFASQPTSHHIWLSIPSYWNEKEFIARLVQSGVTVVGSEAFSVGRSRSHSAVRVSLGAYRNRFELSQALQHIVKVMEQKSSIACGCAFCIERDQLFVEMKPKRGDIARTLDTSTIHEQHGR